MEFWSRGSTLVCGDSTAASPLPSSSAFSPRVHTQCAHCKKCDYYKKYRCGQHNYHRTCLTMAAIQFQESQDTIRATQARHSTSSHSTESHSDRETYCKWTRALKALDSDEESDEESDEHTTTH